MKDLPNGKGRLFHNLFYTFLRNWDQILPIRAGLAMEEILSYTQWQCWSWRLNKMADSVDTGISKFQSVSENCFIRDVRHNLREICAGFRRRSGRYFWIWRLVWKKRVKKSKKVLFSILQYIIACDILIYIKRETNRSGPYGRGGQENEKSQWKE